MPAIDRYFDTLLERGGSDLHLSIGYPPMIRAKGELVPIENEPLDHRTIVSLMDEIISEDKRIFFHSHRDLDFAYGYEDKARFRANYLYNKWSDRVNEPVHALILRTLIIRNRMAIARTDNALLKM